MRLLPYFNYVTIEYKNESKYGIYACDDERSNE